jgi:hypothetical protein
LPPVCRHAFAPVEAAIFLSRPVPLIPPRLIIGLRPLGRKHLPGLGPRLGRGPDAYDAADSQRGILDAFTDCDVRVVLLLAVDRKRTWQARFKFREIRFVLLAPLSHGRTADASPFVEKQPDIDVAVWPVISAHAASNRVTSITWQREDQERAGWGWPGVDSKNPESDVAPFRLRAKQAV